MSHPVSRGEPIEGLSAAPPEDATGVATSGEWRHHLIACRHLDPVASLGYREALVDEGKIRNVELRERATQLLG
ncbi:hypothetical protein ACQI4F_23780 [Mycolicibacterium vaccae]|uniref:hypothetical protein n=1 Tax=Mycolicibacterium vaccae TaxID=1810 RepID=UPI003CF933E4